MEQNQLVGKRNIQSIINETIEGSIEYAISKNIHDISELFKKNPGCYNDLLISIAALINDFEINVSDLCIALFKMRFRINDHLEAQEDLESSYIEAIEDDYIIDKAQMFLDEGWQNYTNDIEDNIYHHNYMFEEIFPDVTQRRVG